MTKFRIYTKLQNFTTNWRRHLPAVASVILLIMIAQSAATLTWRLLAPQIALPKTGAAYGDGNSQQAARGSNLEALQTRALFGEAPEAQSEPSIDAPETRLNLVLRGLLAGTTEQSSRAIIASGNQERSYSIGDTISTGVIVRAIYPDRVIISRRGNLESVRLPEDHAVSPDSYSAPRATRPTTTSLTGQNNPIAADSSDPVAKIAEVLRPIPVSRNGQQIGYRVYPGRDREKFVELGLQAGDIITAINNVSLTDPNLGAQVFEGLAQETTVTVDLERDGQTQQLVLQTGN